MANQKDEPNPGKADPGANAGQPKPGRLIRWAAIAVFGPISAVILIMMVFVVFGIAIDLSWLRDRIQIAASQSLDRPVTIEGTIELVPTIWPTVQIEGVRIGNPEGWPKADFVRLGLARTQIGVVALLLGDIQIEEITVDGLKINLAVNAKGKANWVLKESAAATSSEAKGESPPLRFTGLNTLSLTNIAATFRGSASDKVYETTIDEIIGSAEGDKPLNLSLKGTVQKVPYAMKVDGSSLGKLLSGDTTWQLKFSAESSGIELGGKFAADLRGQDPKFDLDLKTNKLNIGDVLAGLGVAKGLEINTSGFDLKLAMQGRDVNTILNKSHFSAGFSDGLWRIPNPNTKENLDITLRSGRIEAPVGKPIALVLDGRIDQTPVEITIQIDSLASFAEQKKKLGAKLNIKLLNANVDLTGTAPLPVERENMNFKMAFTGEKFSDFDELLGVSLPPFGPYRLGGEIALQKSGYVIENFVLGVGKSTLTGRYDFNNTQTPPRLKVDLVAPTIQLNDFDTKGWSATGGDADGGGKKPDTAGTTKTAEASEDNVRDLLSPQVMRSLDGAITVNVKQVLSGKDQLGNGKLVVNLKSGRLSIDPLRLNIPAGRVDVGFALEPTETDIGLKARARIERLDYGLLARRLDPKSTTGGLISVDVDLTTRGRDLSDVMTTSNGHIDFAIQPKDLDAGIFDLWAANMFTAIMPSLDSQASNVNCVVARFAIKDGIMRPTALLIDTARIQASGDGTIDFKKGTIEFRAVPRPKRPQMFSAQTPVEVKGRFEDFKAGLPPGALVGTVFRMVTSPVVVPFQWIFSKNAPADGKVACKKAWGRAPN